MFADAYPYRKSRSIEIVFDNNRDFRGRSALSLYNFPISLKLQYRTSPRMM
jgi:hypothetical protein